MPRGEKPKKRALKVKSNLRAGLITQLSGNHNQTLVRG